MTHGKLNLTPVATAPNGFVPAAQLEAITRTIREWGRGIDALVSKVHAQSFTPKLTATTTNPNLGNSGTAVGWWTQIGDHVTYQFLFTFNGAGIAAGTGSYQISVPVVVKPAAEVFFMPVGIIVVRDVSAAEERHYGACLSSGRLTGRVMYPAALGAATLMSAANIGFTPAAGDFFAGQVTYLAA